MFSGKISARLLSGFCLLGLLVLSLSQGAAAQPTVQPAAQQTGQAPAATADGVNSDSGNDSADTAAASQNVDADSESTAATAALDAEQAQTQTQTAETGNDAAAADSDSDSGSGETSTSIADVELFDPELEQSDEALDPQQSGGRFIPTEQLSLDLGVSFPVDI